MSDSRLMDNLSNSCNTDEPILSSSVADNNNCSNNSNDRVVDNQHNVQDRHRIYQNQTSLQTLNNGGGHSLISSVLSQILQVCMQLF